MPTPDQARKELARREMARRELARRGINPSDQPASVDNSAGAGPAFLDRAVDFVAPATNMLGHVGRAMEASKKMSGYNYTVPGMIDQGMGFVQRGASRLGDFAAEELARRGANPYLAAAAGMGVAFSPDIAMGAVMPPMASLGEEAATIAKRGMQMGAKGTIAPLARATAGVPIPATNAFIENPSLISKLAGSEASVGSQMSRVIDLVDAAKSGIGQKFGRIYRRYAQMEGPMQEIIDTPIAQKVSAVSKDIPIAQKLVTKETPRDMIMGGGSDISFEPGDVITEKRVTGFKPGEVTTVPRQASSYDDLLINNKFARQAFAKGDEGALKFLYKKYISPTADLESVPITNSDKLQILTRLKREIQAQAKFNKEPITLRPIDSAKDAAFKTMSKQVDDMRQGLPNGNKLAIVDDAWKEINDIYGTIQRDLADPGKARDTFMRLLKGDTTWLTSGRFANKVKAIKRVEALTGQNILKPAMNELTAMIFKEPFGRGLISQTYPLMAAGAAARAAVTGNFGEAALELAAIPLASPRAIGMGLRAGAAGGRKVMNAANFLGRNAPRLGLAGNRALKTTEESQ